MHACWPVYRVLVRRAPGHVAMVVLLVLLSQLALLATLWLPWKLLMVLTGASAPILLPEMLLALAQKQQVLALGGATVLAYLLHLGAEKAIDWLCEHGARQQWEASDKTGLFNDQRRIARQAYQRLLRSMAATIFTLLITVLLGALYPALLMVFVLWCVFVPLVLRGLVQWRASFMHWLQSSLEWVLGIFVQGGFLCALSMVVWQYWRDAMPPLHVAFVALILLRQALQQVARVVLHLHALNRQRSQVQALFLPEVAWHAPATARSRFDDLLEMRHRKEWIPDVLRSHLNLSLDANALQMQMRTMEDGNIAALLVRTSAAGRADGDFLVKLFNHTRDAAAQQEADLLSLEGKKLPTFDWRGDARVHGHACHVMHWSARWEPLSDLAYLRSIAALRVELMAHEPSPELLARYRRSRAVLPQRLVPTMCEKLLEVAGDGGQVDDLRLLSRRWDELVEVMQSMPLQLMLPGLPNHPIFRDENGGLRIYHWAGWRMEPIGSGWPVSAQIGKELTQALAQAAQKRLSLRSVPIECAQLAARLYEFERRYSLRNYLGAVNMAGGILKSLHALDLPKAVDTTLA